MAIVSAGIIAVASGSVALAMRTDSSVVADTNTQAQHSSPAHELKNDSAVNVEMRSESNSTNGSNSNSTSLSVNGENIDVPANGEVHKTIHSDGQTTQIDVQNSSTVSGNSNSHSSDVNVSSHSSVRSSSTTVD